MTTMSSLVPVVGQHPSGQSGRFFPHPGTQFRRPRPIITVRCLKLFVQPEHYFLSSASDPTLAAKEWNWCKGPCSSSFSVVYVTLLPSCCIHRTTVCRVCSDVHTCVHLMLWRPLNPPPSNPTPPHTPRQAPIHRGPKPSFFRNAEKTHG